MPCVASLKRRNIIRTAGSGLGRRNVRESDQRELVVRPPVPEPQVAPRYAMHVSEYLNGRGSIGFLLVRQQRVHVAWQWQHVGLLQSTRFSSDLASLPRARVNTQSGPRPQASLGESGEAAQRSTLS